MESKKRRSTIRRSSAVDLVPNDVKPQVKRRISFSGKNSVRVFSGEEEPIAWNNSYEISDNLNDETAKNVCASSTTKNVQKDYHENKENVDQHAVIENLQSHLNQQRKNQTNLSTSSNISVLSSTKEMINNSYQNQNTKMYQIENSVDITLHENEKKFQIGKVKSTDKTTTSLYTSSLEDYEKETPSIEFCEKTIDFMRELQNEESNDPSKISDFKNDTVVNLIYENMNQDPYHDCTYNKSTNLNDPMTVYLNESLSISSNEQTSSTNINANKTKTINQATIMELSPNNKKQREKDNTNPFTKQMENETQNKSCQMEIEEETCPDHQINQHFNKIKFSPTIYFDQQIETSPQSKNKNSKTNIPIQNITSEPMEFSPNTSRKKAEEKKIHTDNMNSRRSIHFNQSMEVDAQNSTVTERNRHGAIPKAKSRSTIYFNQPLETSSLKIKSDISEKTDNLNQDTHVPPVKLSQESGFCKILNDSGAISKHGHQPKLVVRKICNPLINITKTPSHLEQQKPLQDNGENEQLDIAKDNAAAGIAIEIATKTDNSLSFSFDTAKHMSLSPESSSPLIPLEFKGYTLKQLNDEIERGNIKVFANAPKTPTTGRKRRNNASHFYLKNVQSNQSQTKNRSTLLFEGVDIPESFTISRKEQSSSTNINTNKQKTTNQATIMQLSRNNEQQYDKENTDPFSVQIDDNTRNKSYEMEIENEACPGSQLNQHFNKIKFRPTIYFDQNIETSPASINKNTKTNIPTHDITPKPVEFFPNMSWEKAEGEKCHTDDVKSRGSINFNQSIEVDTQTSTVTERNRHGAIPKAKSRPTIYFNQPLETSSLKFKTDIIGKTADLNEDTHASPVKLLQESGFCKNFNESGAISKHGYQLKLAVQKICNPLINITKNPCDLEQQILLRDNRKNGENEQLDIAKDNAVAGIESEKATKGDKSLSISFDIVKNMSLSPESSSPLIPLEFKGYTLKQLNDEIERGNIKVFSNAPKIPITNRKGRDNASHFYLKNVQSNQSPVKNRSTLLFEDVGILDSSNATLHNNFETAKPNNIFNFNAVLDGIAKERKYNGKCRYSQADDMMLDNTSFLTRAKLGDETVSRNSSKRDVYQLKDTIDILFDDTIAQSSSKNEEGILRSDLKAGKSCNKENSPSDMFQNSKPIFTQTIDTIKDCNNFMNSSDMMDISEDINKQEHEKEVDTNNIYSLQNLQLETEECEKPVNDLANESKNTEKRKTLMYNQSIIQDEYNRNAVQPKNMSRKIDPNLQTDFGDTDVYYSNPVRETLYFEESITNKQTPLKTAPTEIEKIVRIQNNNNNMDSSNSYPKFYLSNEMSLQNTSMKIEKNCQSERTDKENNSNEQNIPAKATDKTHFSSILGRKTLYFDKEIVLEKESKPIDETNIQIEESNKNSRNSNTAGKPLSVDDDKNLKNLNPSRRTLYFNNEIPLQNASMEITENVQAEKTGIYINHKNRTRKTLYFNSEISLENESNIEQRNTQDDDEDINPSRKTLYFDNEICESFQDINVDYSYINKEKFTVGALEISKTERNKLSVDTNKLSTRRQSIYTHESMELSLDCEAQNKTEIETQGTPTNTKSPNAHPRSLDDLKPTENISNTEKSENEKEKTSVTNSEQFSLYEHKSIEDNNEISYNQSLKPVDNFVLHESAKALSAAKMTLSRQINKSKLSTKQENILMTPINLTGKNHSVFHMTPRLSLLEFTALEKIIGEKGYENTNKRPPLNLTPVFSIPKKRQTLVFEDCPVNALEQTKKVEPEFVNKCFRNGDAMELSGIVPNEPVLQTTPKERKSRIPIPIGSGVKTNISYSVIDTSSNNHKKEDAQDDVEGENFADSVQLMRRYTAYTQKRDSTSVQPELSACFVPAGKLSVFEGNPITISDVSVFFEAQRKSNSYITETKIRLPLDKTDYCTVNPMEKSKKNFANRFINLTLEDLEKTRLNLVQLSYDSTSNEVGLEEEQLLPTVMGENNGKIPEGEKKRQSVNYVPNLSLVCRKCQRCQETLLNETSSSSFQTFVLPELPPLPDLGLDRLRRLRKRPTIADAHVFLKRVSLDRTIINANSSDDDSQIVANSDDDAENKHSAVTKFIEKFKQDMRSFERDLLGQHNTYPEELPFVLRLDALLRNNSTNWIFDYQMQFRGILLFSHKKLLTFTISLTFEEADPLGYGIIVNSVKLEKSYVPEKNWKPIDFFLDFQLKLNLPLNIQWLCKGSNEGSIFNMLQEIDQVCLDTLKMGNSLQLICYTNQASILRDGGRTFVCKIIRKILNSPNNDFKYVDKTEIKVELLNLKKLSFKDILSPRLHNFREEIHLLPTGLQFLKEFLPNPLSYLKYN